MKKCNLKLKKKKTTKISTVPVEDESFSFHLIGDPEGIQLNQ